MRISTKSAAFLAITSMLLTALPAEARPRWSGSNGWRGGGSYGYVNSRPNTYYRYTSPRYYGGYYGGYSSYYGGHYGHNDDLAIAVGAGLLGIMLGSALSSRNRGYSREYDRPKVDYYENRPYPSGYDRYEGRQYERDFDRNYSRSEDRSYQQDLARDLGRDERSRRQDYARNFGRSTSRANQQEVAPSPATGSDRYDRGDYTARYYDNSGKYDPDRYYREGGDGGEGADPFSLNSRSETDKDYGAVGM